MRWRRWDSRTSRWYTFPTILERAGWTKAIQSRKESRFEGRNEGVADWGRDIVHHRGILFDQQAYARSSPRAGFQSAAIGRADTAVVFVSREGCGARLLGDLVRSVQGRDSV